MELSQSKLSYSFLIRGNSTERSRIFKIQQALFVKPGPLILLVFSIDMNIIQHMMISSLQRSINYLKKKCVNTSVKHSNALSLDLKKMPWIKFKCKVNVCFCRLFHTHGGILQLLSQFN